MRQLEQDLGWNKKRIIFLATIGLVIVILALAYLIKTQPQVKGAHTYVPPQNDSFNKTSGEVSQGIRDQISTVKEEVQNLNVSDVATSSPQMQKIINDIKSIQNLPADKAKEACQNICNGL